MSHSEYERKSAFIASRRKFLTCTYNGIGALALGGLLANESSAGVVINPLAPRLTHNNRKAKHCIFLFMQGGVIQMDSFEYKPMLNKLHGKPLSRVPDISGELQGRLTFPHVCVGSPFKFRQHGKTGRQMSELFPHLA